MLIRRPPPDTGICFAWKFTPTPEGTVWLEWVRYVRVNDAYDIHPWRYTRLIPDWSWDTTEPSR